MARHKVISFKAKINSSGKFVQVQITTDLQKPYKFQLTPDTNYPSLEIIEKLLNSALDHCVKTYEKVDVTIDKDRPYVWINVKDFIHTRFSGMAVK